MELDDFKGAWAQYDKKLTENLKFNEVLFKKLNLDKSKREMTTPLNYEIFSVVVGGIFLLFIISSTYRFAGDTILLISGILTSLLCLVAFVFTIQKLNLLSKIDYYNSSVIDLQKVLAIVKKKHLQYKRGEIFLFPIFVLVVIPIVAQGLRNLDIMANPELYIIAMIGSLGLGYPILIWVYKNWYEKKLKNTNDLLQELNKFEREE